MLALARGQAEVSSLRNVEFHIRDMLDLSVADVARLELHLPFAGARMLRDLLRTEGFTVVRKHMTTLMRRMGITALYRKPNTVSERAPANTIYP